MTAAAIRELAMNEVRRRTFWRGETKECARALGISRSHIISLNNGSARLTDATARRILDAARLEELRLADRIEAEINGVNLEAGPPPAAAPCESRWCRLHSGDEGP